MSEEKYWNGYYDEEFPYYIWNSGPPNRPKGCIDGDTCLAVLVGMALLDGKEKELLDCCSNLNQDDIGEKASNFVDHIKFLRNQLFNKTGKNRLKEQFENDKQRIKDKFNNWSTNDLSILKTLIENNDLPENLK